jgi:1-acyl-sn-glycerol-3-phosphate acyltransferase
MHLVVLYPFFLAFANIIRICLTQWIGIPLYWYNRDLYYAYIALTKQSFGLIVTSATQWWTPTKMRVSGDASVAGQMSLTKDGRVEFDFPERMVMIANHQLYTEWAYLWWVAYTNKPRMHGHIYIMLKESLRNLPILGWGMRFYGFIFMSRKMETDEARMKHRLDQLKQVHSGPMSGPSGLDPMWLLIFPEGTNASSNTRKKSAAFAEKIGIEDMKHTLLPRSTGTFFCLNELKGTVDYVYDCTMAYEGVP